MKRSVGFRIICIILAFGMLFANISFVFATGEKVWNNASDDGAIIDRLMEKAVYTSISKKDRESNEYEFPTIFITDAMIEEVKQETGYKGNIYVIDGKIFFVEGTQGFKVTDTDVISDQEGRVRRYTVQLGSGSSNYLEADASDNETGEYSERIKMAIPSLEITADDMKQAYYDAKGEEYDLDSDETSHPITFLGATMMDYANWDGEEPSNLWNHTVSFSKIDNGGTVSIKDSNNKQIAYKNILVDKNGKTTFGDYSGALEHIIEKLNPKQKTDFNIKATGDEETRRVPFKCANSGTYVIKVYDKYGNPISNFMVYDENGNPISIETGVAGAYASGLLSDGQYYIELPDGSEYSINVECVTANDPMLPYTKYDEQRVREDIKTYNGTYITEAPTEWHERMFISVILWIGKGIRGLISLVIPGKLSIDALIFDRYKETTLTFFKADNEFYIDSKTGESFVNPLIENGGVAKALNNVFGDFQKIAATVYVIILVYMGIRVLLISTADKKAKFKQLIMYWIKGVAILFLFPYVIRYAILLNHGIVTYIYANAGKSIENDSPGIGSNVNQGYELKEAESLEDSEEGKTNYMQTMYNKAANSSNPRMAYAICWFIMLIQMIQFWIVYMMRFIKITFLIAIFPLIAISYAIDKIGDGKSQAFDHWFKEFLLEVFVQTFHAINYVVVMGIVFKFASTNWFLAIIGITYVSKGSDIIRSLFAQMRGGGAGGPMNPAKALIKASVITSGIKTIGSVAKGIAAPIGKGASTMGLGYQKILDARWARSEKAVTDYNRTQGTTKTIVNLTQNAPGVTVKLNKNEIQTLIESMDNPDVNYRELATKFASLQDSENALNAAINGMQITDEKKALLRNRVQNIANAGAAGLVLTAHKGRSTNVEIQQAVDICMKNMTNSDFTKTLEGFELDKPGKLRDIAAQHSITINQERRNERLARESSLVPPTTETEKIKYATNAIKTAAEGEYSFEELEGYSDYLNKVRLTGSDEEKSVLSNEMKDSNYSIDQFRVNLAVQTINHSNVLESESKQEYIDKAIRVIDEYKEDKKYLGILSRLENVTELKEGYVPVVKHKDTVESERQALISDIVKRTSKGEIDYGPEADFYTDQFIQESAREGYTDLAVGGIQTVAGTASATLKGTAVASATMLGAGVASSTDAKGGNPYAGMAAIIPEAAASANKVVSAASEAIGYIPSEIGRMALEGHDKSRKINRDAYEQNMKQLKDEQALKYTENVIRAREEQREALNRRLEKLNAKKNK